MTELGAHAVADRRAVPRIGLLGGPITNRARRPESIRARSASAGGSLDGAGDRVPDGHGRDLAGERGRPLRASGRRSRRRPARGRVPRLRPLGHRGRRPLRVRHRQARARAVAGRAAAGAAPRRRRLRPRPAQARRDAHVLPRRGRGERRGSRCSSALAPEERATLVARAEDGGLRFDIRPPGRRRRRRSSRCDAVRSRSSCPQELRDAVSDRAWLQAMLDAERALAKAGAAVGLVPADAAAAIAEACSRRALRRGAAARSDGRARREPGRAARPRARATRSGEDARAVRAPRCDEPGRRRHRGDARRAATRSGSCSPSSTASRTAARRSPATHRSTPMAARTLLQQAVPTTFGLQGGGLARRGARGARAARERPRRAPRGAARRRRRDARRARRPTASRSSDALRAGARARRADRSPGTRTACASPSSAPRCRSRRGVLAKIGLDLALLAQTEVGEVAEGGEAAARRRCRRSATRSARRWRGPAPRSRTATRPCCSARSSASTSARAGAWHAEWEALSGALAFDRRRAQRRSRTRSTGSRSTPSGCARTSTRRGGLVVAERVAFVLTDRLGRSRGARASSRDASLRAAASGRPLAEELEASTRALTSDEIATRCSTRRRTSARPRRSSTARSRAYEAERSGG